MTEELAAKGGQAYSAEFIPLHRASFGLDEIEELKSCLQSGWVTRGPLTARFENDFARYVADGDPQRMNPPLYALGLNSCTAALHTALAVAGVGAGDEVITTPITFAATVNVIEHAGATPVLVDVHPDTLCIDETKIEAAVTEKTKAIIPVHYAGHPCEMDMICGIAKRHGLTVIEDCAHAIEAKYRGRRVGTFGDFACFSFYATKNITTGEGGMLVTRNAETLDKARVFSLHGMSKNAWQRYEGGGFELYDVELPGFKYNMFDIQAAIGIHQLQKIEGFHASRKWLCDDYREFLEDFPEVRPLEVRENCESAYHIFVCELDIEKLAVSRNEFLGLLLKENVQGYVHFIPVIELGFYKTKYGWGRERFPVASNAGDRIVSLPLYPSMSRDEVKKVVGAIGKVLSHVRK